MSDTPKHWREYEKYINGENAEGLRLYRAKKKEIVEAYEALPWYKRILTQDPLHDWLEEWDIYNISRKPSLLDYYHWDTNIRGNEL